MMAYKFHRAAAHSAHLARAVAVVFDDAAQDHDAAPRHAVRVEDYSFTVRTCEVSPVLSPCMPYVSFYISLQC